MLRIVVIVGVLVALVGATIRVATMLVATLTIGPTVASFWAAAMVATGVALPLAVFGACYQWWARTFWGAPFHVGDRVRIVRGPGTGAEATVVELGQGVAVQVEYDDHGQPQRRRLLWGGLRRIGSPPPVQQPEATNRDA